MHRIALIMLLLAAGPAWADDAAMCTTRQAELSKQAASFHGDTITQRLIEADLKRALKELGEGDPDECLEALDHAAMLLAGGG